MSYTAAVEYWQEQEINDSARIECVLNGKIINFAYHSGRIENPHTTYDDTREIFEHDGVSNYSGDLRTLFEIKNAKDAIMMILSAYDQRTQLTEEFIKSVQYELTKNTYDSRRWQQGERPGEYKKHDYIVGMNEVGASAEDTAEEMGELLADMAESRLNSDNVLKAAAYFHCKMENIHPFSDGNGRTGRLLVNYLLMLYNHPPMIIFNEDKKLYFAALRQWDEEQSIDRMVEFLQYEIDKTWKKA